MRSTAYTGFAIVLACTIGMAVTADGAEPGAGPTTLWSFLGIPQAIQKLRDVGINRRGKLPKLERKPPLKRIADPANIDPASIEGQNPAIKAAAEIKMQEDLAKQKVKAIKYLASIGCGRYKGGDEALLAALSDYTEEVRYQAAMAFSKTAGDPCEPCTGKGCCNAKAMTKLHEMAYEQDENCCYKEKSARVRAAARKALDACQRVMPPAPEPTPAPEEVPTTRPDLEEVPMEEMETAPSPESTTMTSRQRVEDPGPFSPPGNRTLAIVDPISLTSSSQADEIQLSYQQAEDNPPGDAVASARAWPVTNQAEQARDSPQSDSAEYDLSEDIAEPSDYSPDGVIRLVHGLFRVAAYQPPAPAPEQPVQPPAPPTLMPGARDPQLAMHLFPPDVMERAFEAARAPPTAPVEAASGEEAILSGASDLGGLLQGSSNVQSVEVQRRSPVSLDPNIRGFRGGQVYTLADGVYWSAARQDLDTMLSKIDPGMVRDVIVIPGPYGLRYGPGFAFIDVIREPTPRYPCGFETHFRTSGTVRTNGGQFYGRETVSGGCKDWGFRFSYGHRRGSDYLSGHDLHVPSSYHNRDVWGEIGYDVNPYQHIEFAYQRLDQTDTEYPGQFFDISDLGSYGFQLRVIDEDPRGPWSKLTIEAWYNRTDFFGNTDGKSNPNFPVADRVTWALDQELQQEPYTSELHATTNGAVASAGARVAATFGDPDYTHINLGADFRYLTQNIHEQFNVTPRPGQFETNMPRSWLSDPGLYAEWSSPLTEDWTVSLGGRADFLQTTARASDLRPFPSLPGGGSNLAQDEVLYAFYLMNEFMVDQNWTLRAGFGHAQRPPTLIERYSDSLFLGIVQSGFTRVIGDPNLNHERNWQIDVGLNADYGNWRGKASAFHSWILDYVTLEDDTVIGFMDARLLRFTNTSFATLTGFELAGEFDLAPRLSVFGAMRYVDGRDQEIHAPLPAIPPLDGIVGVRLHDLEQGRRWGIECAARIVDDQDRLGTIRLYGGTPTVLEERTPGFTVWDLRAYYNWTRNLSLIAGIENVFDKNYQEHLDLRLLGPQGFRDRSGALVPPSRVLSPGFTPYFSIEWLF